MLQSVIIKDMYKDSVALMLINNKINAQPSVKTASIMMATPANKDMFKASGLLTPEIEKATANDIAVALELNDQDDFDNIIALINEELSATSKSKGDSQGKQAEDLTEALEFLPDANLALISIPGIYAYSVGKKCLDDGLNLFIFSDNVALEKEKKLKEIATEKGLLVMGPDCGTGILQGVPFAFANQCDKGSIGIVGAAGTGIQEVCSVLDDLGHGISHAIGTGGRDLHEAIGASTFLRGIDILRHDPDTKVILLLSKPPAKAVREQLDEVLKGIEKPVVSLFLGETPTEHLEGCYYADTLEELATIGAALVAGEKIAPLVNEADVKDGSGTIKGLFTGGTLATEASLLIQRGLGLTSEQKPEHGYILKHEGFEVIDLGDDEYTQGKPHPMIDPEARLPFIEKAATDASTKVIALDVVLGYGANEDPASTLEATIKKVKQDRPDIEIVCNVCGTKRDPQGLESQMARLKEAGAVVFRSNRKMLDYALGVIGKKIEYKQKPVVAKSSAGSVVEFDKKNTILSDPLRVINIGLESFADTLNDFNVETVQYNFRPIAGGKKELMQALDYLEGWRADA